MSREKLREVADTLEEVRKVVVNTVFPPPKEEKPSEYMQMHWCDKCKKYHKAE